MRRVKRMIGVAAAASAALLLGNMGTAQSQAQVIECSAIFPELGGVIVFQPSGGFTANCHEHLHDGTPGAEGETTIFDCSEALPEVPPEQLVGVQVITASGNVLTNCHVHVRA